MGRRKSIFISDIDAYQRAATTAGRYEREGNYKEAGRFWRIAKPHSCGKNISWCEHREAFCERMVRNPFIGE